VATVARPAPAITVAFGLVKGDRPEWVVQKLTELGVDRIVPLATERAVVRWDEAKAARQHERLGTVAREAAMQCRRVWLPEVAAVTGFSEAARWAGAVLAEPGGSPPTLDHPVLLVGPEGGWSPAELAAGLPMVELSDGVLRSETAAITGGVILTALRATMRDPSKSHKEEGSVHPAVEPHRVVF
jgi:16S rRNA (uracil1498-N3)-methyltransferase